MAPKTRPKRDRGSTSNEPVVPVEPLGGFAQLMPANLHPWLRLDQPGPIFNSYCERFLKIYERQYVCPRNPDWEPLEQAGISGNIREVLTSRYYTDEGRQDYEDWVKLFDLWAPIYKELCLEFLSTVRIKEKGVRSATDRSFMSFRLGGEERQMSYRTLATSLGLYTVQERNTVHFNDFLMTGAQIGSLTNEPWSQLSEKPYKTNDNYVRHISNVNLRVIQRFLSHTITQRDENTERVTQPDMWFLEKFDDGQTVNIPYCVAWFLVKKASGRKASSPICGGHFITAIARYFDIDCAGLTGVRDPRVTVGIHMYMEVEAIKRAGNTYVPWAAQEGSPPHQRPRTDEGPSHTQGQGEEVHVQDGFQGEPHGRFEGPQPSLSDIMSGISRLGTQNEGINRDLGRFRQEFSDFSHECRYRLGALEYTTDWMVHDQQRYHAEPAAYQQYPYQSIPRWSTPETAQPPPSYHRASTLEEAQQMHQEQFRQRDNQQPQDPQPGQEGFFGYYSPY